MVTGSVCAYVYRNSNLCCVTYLVVAGCSGEMRFFLEGGGVLHDRVTHHCYIVSNRVCAPESWSLAKSFSLYVGIQVIMKRPQKTFLLGKNRIFLSFWLPIYEQQ